MKILSLVLSLLLVCVPCFGGVDFDGSDDYITMGNILDKAHTDAFSICALFNTSTFSGGRTVIGKLDNGGNFPGYEMHIADFTGDDGKIYFYIINNFGSNYIQIKSTSTVNDGSDHYVCCTYDGSESASNAKIYIDGTEESTIVADTLSATISNSASFMIGSRNNENHWFDGIIYEGSIFDKELSQSEVTLLTDSKLKRMPLQISNNSGYWALDDEPDGTSGDGDTFKDLSGNGNDGTGDDGANNTGLTATAETVLSYPPPY